MSAETAPSAGTPRSDGKSLQDRLIAFLDQLTSQSSVKLEPHTEIFSVSLFDSLALVELVLWVENEVGGAVDLSEVDFKKEWATVVDIVAFIQRVAGDAGRGE